METQSNSLSTADELPQDVTLAHPLSLTLDRLLAALSGVYSGDHPAVKDAEHAAGLWRLEKARIDDLVTAACAWMSDGNRPDVAARLRAAIVALAPEDAAEHAPERSPAR